MAATIATMAMLNAKCFNSPKTTPNPSKPQPTKPICLLSTQNLPKGMTTAATNISSSSTIPTSLAGTTIAGAIFSTLSFADAAMAAQQIAEIAEGDNRGLALLIPLIPAVAWVLYNILQPALNQLNQMRSSKGVIVGLGLGGLATSGIMASPPHASAAEIAMIADATGDNRGQLLLFVVTPAIVWVLYNILQPALNQINRMRS